MTLQYNPSTGSLIYHLCQTTDDPDSLGKLMSECCCTCDPPIAKEYTITWSQTGNGQDYFWIGFYDFYSVCNRFNDNSPFKVYYVQDYLEALGICTWRSENFANSPSNTTYTFLELQWNVYSGEWTARVRAGHACVFCNKFYWICTDTMDFSGYPSAKTNRCDPRGDYRCDTYPINTDREGVPWPSGANDVQLEINFKVS